MDRRPKSPKYGEVMEEKALLKEVRSIQMQLFGSTDQMPSKNQLCALGRPELVYAINNLGGALELKSA